MERAQGQQRQALLMGVARDALRWVSHSAVAATDGPTWPDASAPGAPLADDLYGGTAGVLVALSEARLAGIADFDEQAAAAARRLRKLAESGVDAWRRDGSGPDAGLYTGLCGMMAALDIWGQTSGDQTAIAAARDLADRLSQVAADRPVSEWLDVIAGDAGILLVVTALGGTNAAAGASRLADRLVAAAEWVDGLPDWRPRADYPALLPNFSHGLAGIGFALAAASRPLGRPELLELAELGAMRLISLGQQPDGSLVVPHSIPLADPQAPVSYGWCHGPTGTLRLFGLLDREQPGQGWARWADACRAAVRRSGLPERLYPGFWDNIGQCCGTAGVGEMALDQYQDSADPQWLAWAQDLAEDVLNRRITDECGVRWSHTEHRLPQPQLQPSVGWMQGAAGIAGWLLRLARVERDGTNAARTRWPDHPGPSTRTD